MTKIDRNSSAASLDARLDEICEEVEQDWTAPAPARTQAYAKEVALRLAREMDEADSADKRERKSALVLGVTLGIVVVVVSMMFFVSRAGLI